jgi:uncharacterized protein YjiS (DUF1127 family)
MSTNIINQFVSGKLGALLFTRQAGFAGAGQHKSLLGGIAAWRARRAAAAELSGLSDRELADIGLTRSQIPQAVKNR